MNFPIPQQTSLENFVKYWSGVYDDTNEKLYTENINQPLAAEQVMQLFIWKNGGKLSKLKEISVKKNYISRIADLETLPKNTSAKEWLDRFGTGEAIWNIFFLHIWNSEIPIFDQHVYRAMRFIQTGTSEEIPPSKKQKTKIYLEDYLPFYNELNNKITEARPRDLDRALWKFGQFLKWFKSN
jgi:hypothetical protein